MRFPTGKQICPASSIARQADRAIRVVWESRVRQEILEQADTLVVKVGTNVLADAKGRLDPSRLADLAQQIAELKKAGKRVVLVSSGAIGAGVGRLALSGRPTDLPGLQACAAVGQCFLMRAWEDAFVPHGIPTAQILLTAGDFDNRTRYLNARNTILTLLEWGAVPIINENDTVSVAEIRFGDNDTLAAMVANLIRSPILVLLSVIDGLFERDPNTDPSAKVIREIPEIDDAVLERAGVSKSSLGTGGMKSKLKAARMASIAGASVFMARGTDPGILKGLFGPEEKGTLFLAKKEGLPSWKRWIGYTAQPRGSIKVDAGAARALVSQGKSLLPIGITDVTGNFHKGAVVTIVGTDGIELARGLSNYSAADTLRIKGLRSEEIASRLGAFAYAEVVHRDNLVVLSES